jgi:flagellar export protein FliJ
MRRFTFKLDPVLDVRAKVERARQREVAVAELEVQAAREKLAALEGQLEELRTRIRRRHRDFDVAELRAAYVRLDFLERERASAEETVAARAQALAGARELLIHASKERKMLETLKRKRRAAHDHEAALKEHRALDDANGRREAIFGANTL